MAQDLQRIVDEVGSRLQRATAIDDTQYRLQVYSPHHGHVDDIRLACILHREAPSGIRAWADSLGLADATGPVRTPANDEFGLMPRVCAPIRFQGVHLGYLWLMDGDQSMTEAQLSEISETADRLAVIMYRANLLEQLDRGQERELLRDLLSGDEVLMAHAASQLVERDLFAHNARPVVIVFQPVHSSQETATEDERVIVESVLESARGRVSVRHALHLVRPDFGVLVVAENDPSISAVGTLQLARELADALSARLGGRRRVVVGVGEAQQRLQDTEVSYRQAFRSANVAGIVTSLGDVVSWSNLGIYRTLSLLPQEALSAEATHPGLLRLLDDPAYDSLVSTLETYLDRAGDAQATAAYLQIHRTSLYYRLGRVEELADVDLKDGDDRLALHLGLKTARLGGIPRALSPHA